MLAGRYRRASLSGPVLALWVAAGDLVVLTMLHWFALYAAGGPGFAAGQAAAMAAGAAGLGAGALAFAGAYRVAALRRGLLAAAWLAAALIGGAGLLALALPGAVGPGPYLAAALAWALAGALPLRLLLAGFLGWADGSNLLERRAVLVGGGENARRVIEGLAARPGNDIRVAAIFDDRSGARSPDLVLDVPRIGRVDDLAAFAQAAEIDLVIVTLPASAEARIEQLLARFAALPIPVHLSAFSADYAFAREAEGMIALVEGAFTPGTRLRKRMFDLAVASVALMILSPLIALVALAIRVESPGPVLFRQWRTGLGGRAVKVWKFRSMRQEAADPDAARPVTREDDRVTRVGRFIRRTSLDELPQLVNVLRGELSLVGPRPHAVDARAASQDRFDAMVEHYARRHRLPPGITGWAQINGLRGTVEDADHIRARVEHDLWYIENWSLALDLRILALTPLSLLSTRNAF
jgi:Undecaprenyl-phosphate glucose phosphotransferase